MTLSTCHNAPIIGHLDSPSGDPIRCSECGEIDDGLETRSLTTNEEAEAIVNQMKRNYEKANMPPKEN
jgi:uncharacterized Zn finger protein